ncbi:MAG: hypothetical protein DWH91_14195 [Planctomycetota bacterium]|nr:MAG: hypothetical protein DWH91_14195 [Planctomycetota bacterium]
MANLNNINGTVNFSVAGNVQTGTAVVCRSRRLKMRSHTGKPLTQPHYLRLDSLSSRETQEWAEAAGFCSAAAAWQCCPAAEIPPAAWGSLVISRAITL